MQKCAFNSIITFFNYFSLQTIDKMYKAKKYKGEKSFVKSNGKDGTTNESYCFFIFKRNRERYNLYIFTFNFD